MVLLRLYYNIVGGGVQIGRILMMTFPWFFLFTRKHSRNIDFSYTFFLLTKSTCICGDFQILKNTHPRFVVEIISKLKCHENSKHVQSRQRKSKMEAQGRNQFLHHRSSMPQYFVTVLVASIFQFPLIILWLFKSVWNLRVWNFHVLTQSVTLVSVILWQLKLWVNLSWS
jgi:hypothetical protein